MEDILKIQKGYAIPDPELREQMKKDNKDFIIPAFRMFLDKFKRLNFTKNPEKYIKYSVQDVAEVVDKLFDMSAWYSIISVNVIAYQIKRNSFIVWKKVLT